MPHCLGAEGMMSEPRVCVCVHVCHNVHICLYTVLVLECTHVCTMLVLGCTLVCPMLMLGCTHLCVYGWIYTNVWFI